MRRNDAHGLRHRPDRDVPRPGNHGPQFLRADRFLAPRQAFDEAALKYVLLARFSSGILAIGSLDFIRAQRWLRHPAQSPPTAQRDNWCTPLRLASPWRQGRTDAAAGARSLPLALNFDPFVLQLLPVLALRSGCGRVVFQSRGRAVSSVGPDVYEARRRDCCLCQCGIQDGEFCSASAAIPLRLFSSQKVSQEQWMYLIAGVAVASLTGAIRRADADQC